MTKLAAGSLAGIALTRTRGSAPLVRQVSDAVRLLIEQGRLQPGRRLPSSRILALELGVSRGTVTTAFEELFAEGYIEGAVGSGTYVARLPPRRLRPLAHRADGGEHIVAERRATAGRTAVMRRAPAPAMRPTPQTAFEIDVPALDAFPYRLWERLAARQCARGLREVYACSDPGGYPPLREALAAHLAENRGLRCDPRQIIVVTGALQAIDLIGRVLLDPGDQAWVEEPGHSCLRTTLQLTGATLVPVPVDGGGLVVEAAIAAAPAARLALVTPSMHYPLGATMSMDRRLRLLSWARASGGWIAEDDTGFELSRAGREQPSLWSMDPDGGVIYLTTCRATLLPSLRLGFLVVPKSLVDTFLAARFLADGFRPVLEQAVLAEFMLQGHFASHVRRMRGLYRERHAALVGALENIGSRIDHANAAAPAGLHVACRLQSSTAPAHVVARRAMVEGVVTRPLSDYYIGAAPADDVLLLGAAFPPWMLRDAVKRLDGVLRGLS